MVFLPSALKAPRLSAICSGSDTGDVTDNYIHEKSSVGWEKPHGAGAGSSTPPRGCCGTNGGASLAPQGLGLAQGPPSWGRPSRGRPSRDIHHGDIHHGDVHHGTSITGRPSRGRPSGQARGMGSERACRDGRSHCVHSFGQISAFPMADLSGSLGIAGPLLPPNLGKPTLRSPSSSLQPWGPHRLLLLNTLNL